MCVVNEGLAPSYHGLFRHEVTSAWQDKSRKRFAVWHQFHKIHSLETDNELEVLKKERCNTFKRNLGWYLSVTHFISRRVHTINPHRNLMALLCGTCDLPGRKRTSNPELERFRSTYTTKFRENFLLSVFETIIFNYLYKISLWMRFTKLFGGETLVF